MRGRGTVNDVPADSPVLSPSRLVEKLLGVIGTIAESGVFAKASNASWNVSVVDGG